MKDMTAARPKFIAEKDIQLPVDSESNRFPQLKLIQAISPEVTKGEEKYIPGISAGDLLLVGDGLQRTIEGDEGIKVVPLATRKRYVEYIPRAKGGGFVAEYADKEEADLKFEPGNELVASYDFLCVEADQPEPTPFVITFDSPTKLGVAKKWAGYFIQYKSVEGVAYKITSKSTKNKANQSYFSFNVTPIGWLDESQYKFTNQLVSSLEPMFLPAPTNSDI